MRILLLDWIPSHFIFLFFYFFLLLHSKNINITGQRKIDDLRNNSNYFRKGLINMGLQVLGDADSPVMPVLLYNPTKIGAFSRECLKRGLAVRYFFVDFLFSSPFPLLGPSLSVFAK